MHGLDCYATFTLLCQATSSASSRPKVAVTFLGQSYGSEGNQGKIPVGNMALRGHARNMTGVTRFIRFSHIPLSPARIIQD